MCFTDFFKTVCSVFKFAIVELVGLRVGPHSRGKQSIESPELVDVLLQFFYIGGEYLIKTFLHRPIPLRHIRQTYSVGAKLLFEFVNMPFVMPFNEDCRD